MKIIYSNGTVAECPAEEELHVLRHSAAHIMAQAIKRLYPDAYFAYGPANEKGFYYDVDLGDIFGSFFGGGGFGGSSFVILILQKGRDIAMVSTGGSVCLFFNLSIDAL